MFGRFATVQCGNWTSGGGSKNVENFEQLRVTLQVTMNILRVLAGVVGALVLPCGAVGQSFNIDIDVEAGGPEVGAGVPSNAFGAAANQPGFWTLLGAAQHTHAYPLFGLDGTATAATVRWKVSGGGAGSGMGNNTGDFRLLLNDCTKVSVPTTYHFENILPGRYKLTTYAVDRGGNTYPTRVTVPGAVVTTKLSGNGAMPGDRFIESITHCIHEFRVAGTTFVCHGRVSPRKAQLRCHQRLPDYL